MCDASLGATTGPTGGYDGGRAARSIARSRRPLSTRQERTKARIQVPEGEGLEASRIWKVAPHLGLAMHAMSKAVYEESSLAIREREVMRMRIAQLNACHV